MSTLLLLPAPTTLAEARETFWSRAQGEGFGQCPCCDRRGKVYRRKLNSGMVWWLLLFYRHCQATQPSDGWVHVDNFPRQAGDESGSELAHHCEHEKLQHWGLLERFVSEERTGLWRITPLGYAFIAGEATVQSHALTYDKGVCLGLDGRDITLKQALGKKFCYDELMGREAA